MTTIGVAVPLPEPWAGELQRNRASFGDPLAYSIPTHVTLVPPTEAVADLAAIEEHLAQVAAAHESFRLSLSGTATFRPVSPVVFVAVREGISNCEMLAAAARSGPLRQRLTFPYHPHVTVAHDLEEEALDKAYETLEDFQCSFDVREFDLYVHGDDWVWRPVRTFTLRAAASAPPAYDRRS